jgi:hypothetical protein
MQQKKITRRRERKKISLVIVKPHFFFFVVETKMRPTMIVLKFAYQLANAINKWLKLFSRIHIPNSLYEIIS